ncbi:MAG TPA: HAD hydrolase family protein [Gemmatimonadales bacterium]|nr:HAD hydrolase family protein [Gemmatimonadales bacterium]
MIDPAVARRIAVVGFDVDGVLTDGGVYLGLVADHAAECKRFHVPDGLGLKMLQWAGLHVIIVSGRVSEATTLRARELGIPDVIQDDGAQKLPALERWLGARRLTLAQCAFVGDDLPDVPVLKRVALPIAVHNACAEVKALATVVTGAEGGRGAAREAAELILKARGVWDERVEAYLNDRGDGAERTIPAR